jgi:homoserine kinase type II
MAVYTHVSAEAIAAFLERFEAGVLTSAKGIAEGVENSNYMLVTSEARFILTLYEKRVDPADLPFFLGFMNHLAQRGLPVPRAIADRDGATLHDLSGRKACLIEFLPGLSVSDPNVQQAKAVGRALAAMRLATADFSMRRENSLSLAGWQRLAALCAENADRVEAGLGELIDSSLESLAAQWPQHLPVSAIHADLFPDNVLFMGDAISGLIDFYFGCTDIAAYDLAVCWNAWGFDARGTIVRHDLQHALTEGYASLCPLSSDEEKAMPILAQGAALRFLLSRLYDWINTPADALVTRKDPLDYARRLRHWQAR